MAEDSYFWGGTTIGDAGPYNDEEFGDVMQKMVVGNRSVQGVFKNVYDELEITAVDYDTIAIASGVAMIDGRMYTNTSSMNKDVVQRGVGLPNYYSVVLQKDFVAQTVRAVLKVSPTNYPAVVQNEASIWEIEIYRILVPGGPTDNLVITDMRNFCAFNTVLRDGILDNENAIVDGTISTNKMKTRLITDIINCPVGYTDSMLKVVMNPGFGHFTSSSTYSNFYMLQYRIPDNVIPNGFSSGVGVRMWAVFSNHGHDPETPKNIVISFHAYLDQYPGTGETVAQDDSHANIVVTIPGDDFYAVPESLLEFQAIPGDIVMSFVSRNGGNVNDSHVNGITMNFNYVKIQYYIRG